ncbi:hypothetical protein HA050_08615 [Iodobacter sp. HSC-16F04]|uniref:Integron gene cassette protein n=1 Tax=Iodobacter violaceini TaxID=3044271 RepID=A0ABX0KQL5_9NEIS|nr:hypothetical protein [Iodobacter violacea]NHQ86177.1 hypothetical protein [Iodobacter violacea]
MNLIVERTDSAPWFTNMNSIFRALGFAASNYDWFISDIETNYYGTEFTSEDQWISGDTLECFITENNVQFIWAVFSAFPKETRFPVENPPNALDPGYWSGTEVTPQLKNALFEIVAWDSSATILIGLPDAAIEKFRAAFPDTKSLISAANQENS